MKKEPRYYQKDACNAVVKAWRNREITCISMMTALGKALCAAMLSEYGHKKNMRVLCLVPTKELVNQNYEECLDYIGHDQINRLGRVCLKLNKKQNNREIVIAMYQSFYSLRAISGTFGMIIIDEAHLVSNNELSQIRKIVKSQQRINPDILIMGMTASPYRLGQGFLTEKCIKGTPLFTSICYDTSVEPGIKKLIEEKYLAEIRIMNTHYQIDLTGVKMSGLEYNQTDVGIKFDNICDNAVEDFRQGFIDEDIETSLIFVPNCEAGKRVLACWGDLSTMRMVSNETSDHDRDETTKWFKHGYGKRYLVNVNIYTTGFNFPALQSIVLLRATTSPGLLIQILGRLVRPYGDLIGKVWDYGSNIERLGGIDNIQIPKNIKKRGDAPKKICTAVNDGILCNHVNILAAKKCAKCKAEFVSINDEGNYSMRTVADVLAAKVEKEKFTYEVFKITFDSYQKTDVPMIKMFFWDEDAALLHTEYLCIEHTGSARGLAIAKIKSLMKSPGKDWYQISKFENGHNVKNMLFLLNDFYGQYFKTVKTITLVRDGRFNKLLEWQF